ncbi:hypothetical protein, partial [Senegalimassilia anaerobia]|uniref:hypothetical protein n=1 Tax=Senegalimassilia anaerobia TaxID=1473216 RepID=UPI002E798BEF
WGQPLDFEEFCRKRNGRGEVLGDFGARRRFWGNVTRAFVEHLREMGAKTAQNFGTHGKFRLEKLQNRPEVRGCVKCALG